MCKPYIAVVFLAVVMSLFAVSCQSTSTSSPPAVTNSAAKPADSAAAGRGEFGAIACWGIIVTGLGAIIYFNVRS